MTEIASILPQQQLPDDLYRRLHHFVESYCVRHESLYEYGWGHLLFACYAAFPAHLSPDLLHKIRLNFRHYSIAEKKPKSANDKVQTAEIHPIAVNDLLLSNLVRETGFERLEMPEELRHYLLWLLQKSGVFEKKLNISPLPPHETTTGKPGVARLHKLAEFLRRYAAEHYIATDPVTRSLREAQEWTADAWQYPEQAAARIRQRLFEAQKTADQYHFSRLNNRLGVQYQLQLNSSGKAAPASFQSLHHYTQGLVSMYTGKNAEAMASIAEVKNLVKLKGAPATSDTPTLRLPMPGQVVTELLKTSPELAFPPPGTKPRRWRSLEERLGSPYPKTVLAIGDGDRIAIAGALVRMEDSLRREHGDPALLLADYFDIVAGVGMGAFMAGMIAIGENAEEILEVLQSENGVFLKEPISMDAEVFHENVVIKFGSREGLPDSSLRNGLVFFMENTATQSIVTEDNLTNHRVFDPAHLTDTIIYSLKQPGTGQAAGKSSEQKSPSTDQRFHSAASNPLFSLELAVTELLNECQIIYNWPSTPDRLMLVSVKAPAAQEALASEDSAAQLHRYLAHDMRWLERHTLDLLRQHRMLYFDGMGEVQWPEWFGLEKKPASLSESKASSPLPKPLPELRQELKALLSDDLGATVQSLDVLLPENSDKKHRVAVVKGRYNELNKNLLRDTISNEEYQISRNQIRVDLLDLIDSLEEADLLPAPPPKSNENSGYILYRIPSEMQINHEERCIVRIAFDEDVIKDNFTLDEHTSLKPLRVSDMMSVEIVDPEQEPAYSIRALNESVQLVYEKDYTEWKFYVKRLREGGAPLQFKIATIELTEGRERRREIIL